MPIVVFAEEGKGDWQEIRERIIRIEERMVTKEELKAEIRDVRNEIKDVRGEIKNTSDDLKGFMLWGFGVIFMGMFSLVVFVLWDRRTALAPAIKSCKELEEREARLEKALKEFALKEPRLAEGLRYAGLL